MHACRLMLPWLLFPVLSGADLFLTWWLLGHEEPSTFESNPVAAWCLRRHGWAGLALFKLALVTLVLGSVAAVAWRHPRVAARVLAFGCVVLSGVVGYSVWLAGSAGAFGERFVVAHASDLEYGHHLTGKVEAARRHQALKDELSLAMREGRCTLPEAVERFMTSDLAADHQWLRPFKHAYSVDAPRDCWAVCLLRHALLDLNGDISLWERHAPDWIAAYQANFQVAAPPPWAGLMPAGFRLTDSRLALVVRPAF